MATTSAMTVTMVTATMVMTQVLVFLILLFLCPLGSHQQVPPSLPSSPSRLRLPRNSLTDQDPA
eukprot:1715857-Pyramimonas_sp.AAC.2